jgi:hypothetical protein
LHRPVALSVALPDSCPTITRLSGNRISQVLGGHPLLVHAVEETLEKSQYAPASGESTALLEFEFHP